MSTRREFLERAISIAALPLAAGQLARASSTRARIHLGAQTNAWGVPIRGYDHLLEILGILSGLGYQGFETNYNTLRPFAGRASECRRDFKSHGVRLVASHNGSSLYVKDQVSAEIKRLRRIAGATAQMGAAFLIVSGRRLPHPDGKLDLGTVHAWTDSLNRLGEAVKQEGLKLCYHNHSQEFEDHPPQISYFFRETDPRLVWLNFDDGHAFGLTPSLAAFSAEHYRRIAIYHFKDMKRIAGGKIVQTAMGQGAVNVKGIVAPLIHSDWTGWLEAEEDTVYPKPIDDPSGVLHEWITAVKRTIAG